VEVLLAQSTAAVVGTQLWYTQKGGVYLLWYLPLMLMVVFRPRLIHLRMLESAEPVGDQASLPAGRSRTSPILGRALSNGGLQLFR
jgi:hypothetical protein